MSHDCSATFARRLLPSIAATALGAGCSAGSGTRDATPPLSVIEGQVKASSFSSKVTGFTATDEGGRSSLAALGASGAFSLSLPSGHRYALSIATADGAAPLLFPRTNRVDQAIVLAGDGAIVALGTVQLLSADTLALDPASACTDGTTAGAQACTVPPSEVACVGGYTSAAASCDDVDVVLAYGTLAAAIASAPAGAPLAYPRARAPLHRERVRSPRPREPAARPKRRLNRSPRSGPSSRRPRPSGKNFRTTRWTPTPRSA